jgi:hypothetical protein
MRRLARTRVQRAQRGDRVNDPLPSAAVTLVPEGGDADATRRPALAVGADMAIPLHDRSLASIDATPMLERIDPVQAFALVVECRRVLSPGGELRVARVPPRLGQGLDRLAELAGLAQVRASSPTGDPDASAGYAKPDRQLDGQPLVTIAIPAFNPRFFDECLASAVAQTYEPLEIVVCDDSDGPDIEAIAARHARARPLRYLRNRARLHARGNYTRCLEESRGEFVKYLNDDDRLAADCVATLVDAFRRAPDIVLATSWRRRIDAQGLALPDQPATAPIAASDVAIAGPTLANAMLLAGLNIVGEPTSGLFRKSDFPPRDAGCFSFDGVEGRGVIDMTMWASLLPRGNVAWLRRALTDFRIHPEQSQRDPARVDRAKRGIRSLQAAWEALGLQRFLRPREILVQPWPPVPDEQWTWAAVPAFAVVAANQWRNPPSASWSYTVAPPKLLR